MANAVRVQHPFEALKNGQRIEVTTYSSKYCTLGPICLLVADKRHMGEAQPEPWFVVALTQNLQPRPAEMDRMVKANLGLADALFHAFPPFRKGGQGGLACGP